VFKASLAGLVPITIAACLAAAMAGGRSRGVRPPSATPGPVQVTQVIRADSTTSGGVVSAPRGPLDVVMSKYHVAARASLPSHKHPFPRYGYVVDGALEVTNVETGQSRVFSAGDAIIEDVDTWHEARALGDKPVNLLVIDIVEKGASNVVKQ
jgi:quercetin dioxygenase-like cupin family protein